MANQEFQACIAQGNLLCSQSNYVEAINCFKKASTINPKSYSAHFNMANCLRKKGSYEEAIQYYRRAIEIKPDLSQAYNNWGLCLCELGLYSEANTNFMTAISLNPRFYQAFNNSGLCFEAQGAYEEAIIKYQNAIVINNNYAEAYYNWGNCLLAQGKGDEAVFKYEKAIELNPNYSQAYHNIGVVLSAQENYEQAIKKYTKATEIDPDYSEAYINWGLCLYQRQMHTEAMSVFTKGIRASAKNAKNKLEIMKLLDFELTREERALEGVISEDKRKEVLLRIQRIRQILEVLMQDKKASQVNTPTSSPTQQANSQLPPQQFFAEPQLAEYNDFMISELYRLLGSALVLQGGKLMDASDSVISSISLAASYLPPLSETPFDEKVFPLVSRIAPDGILFGDVLTIRKVNKAYQQLSKILTSNEEVALAVNAVVRNLTHMRSQELLGEYKKPIVDKTHHKVMQASLKGFVKQNRITSKSQEYAFFDFSIVTLLVFLEGISVGPNVERLNSNERVELFVKAVVYSMKDYFEALQEMNMTTPIWFNLI